MDDRDKENEGEVKVKDKRRFTADGESRTDAGAGEGEPAAAATPAEGGEKVGGGDEERASRELAPIDFSTFVLSLATSAQVHLGAVPNPATGKSEKDLGLAKQTIDILGLLEEKTKGNLDDNESRLLEHLLFDLRMMYVEQKKA